MHVIRRCTACWDAQTPSSDRIVLGCKSKAKLAQTHLGRFEPRASSSTGIKRDRFSWITPVLSNIAQHGTHWQPKSSNCRLEAGQRNRSRSSHLEELETLLAYRSFSPWVAK